MKCPECQHDNPDNTKFCGECGASLAVDLDSLSPTRTILGPVLRLKKGQMIRGKYKILEKIGEGGMGIVYKAEDTKLKRNVALKFLPSELTRDEKAKARFIQEAQAAAALNHPHICIIHEVDESDDQTFIAMEFIEGETLKDKIEAGPLATDEAIDIASQVAEGLSEAHKKRIVHRDIKPANIMLTQNGKAKIMDFGLAKLSWGADLTKPSMIMGTVAYMSPEQARGEPIDHRTDIWSLGAMLYEMLAGEKPFQKSHEQALIHSILNDEPRRISEVRSDAPDYLEKVLSRALEKKADRRYQNTAELIRELGQGSPIFFPETKKSIVILPFENLSPDPDQEYFSDGLTEEIISDLSQVHELLVISRSAAMTYKGTKKKIREIGRELDVQYALEGSVRKAGNNLRITAQLIDASNDAHLWAKKYSGTLDDVFEIQEKVSRSIVDALQLQLTPREKKKIAERPIDNIQAYECYSQAYQDIWVSTEDSLGRAIQRVKRGLDIIGDNELLYACLGTAYIQYIEFGYKTDEGQFRKAEECLDKVFELNPGSSLGHILRGRIHFKRANTQGAVQEIKQGLISNPNSFEGLSLLTLLYGISGKMSAATPLFRKMREIDPLSPVNHCMKGWQELYDGQFSLAAKSFESMLQMDPGNPLFRYLYSTALAANLQVKEACSVIDLIARDTPQVYFADLGTFLKCAWRGESDKALETVSPNWTGLARFDETFSWHVAGGYAAIRRVEEALDWLENSVNKGVINYPFFAEYYPWFENIRGEPRFKKLMERVKHEWENFEV